MICHFPYVSLPEGMGQNFKDLRDHRFKSIFSANHPRIGLLNFDPYLNLPTTLDHFIGRYCAYVKKGMVGSG